MEGLLDLGFGFVEIGESPLCHLTMRNEPALLQSSQLLVALRIAYTATEPSLASLMLGCPFSHGHMLLKLQRSAGSVTPLPQPGNDKPRSFRIESLRCEGLLTCLQCGSNM